MSDRPRATAGDERQPPPAVVPRARRPGSDASLPVDRLLTSTLRDHARGLVVLTGGPGGGKTTALRYLRATLPATANVDLFDAHQTMAALRAAESGLVVLATWDKVSAVAVDGFALSKWGIDDCLEYLIAAHRAACRSVLSRLAADPSFALLAGVPELVALVLEAMAADPALATARDALRRHAGTVVPPGAALDRLMIDGPAHAALTPDQGRWWRHAGFQGVCVAEWIADQLAQGVVPARLAVVPNDRALVTEVAAALRLRPAAFDHLGRSLEADVRSPTVPMAATVLLATDPAWRPADGRGIRLDDADLAGARWHAIDLTGASLARAKLTGADLSAATLHDVVAHAADLSGASLRGARVVGVALRHALLRGADLSVASLAGSDLTGADLTEARLARANLSGTTLVEADLTGARAEAADFSNADLQRTACAGADFTAAMFAGAKLRDVDLTGADWAGVTFAGASLLGCNLEGLVMPVAHFPGADLTGSLLTGSRMDGAHFRGAKLCQTGLAEVDWPGADLRDADFAGASFHLGSTRSGLVGSTIAGEGSRTGFYTDDYNDQTYRPPEEIRKANLSGANLVGARVEQTDFYLVDLRGATYTPAQAEHFARTGAILGPG